MRCHELFESDDDEAVAKKGYADGLKGKADFEWLGVRRPNEDLYWSNFDWAKTKIAQQKPAKAPPARLLKSLRRAIPSTLAGISEADVLASYQTLVAGHALDGVTTRPSRTSADALAAIGATLSNLVRHFDNGSIMLYRTIQIDDPKTWVRENLSKSITLGIHWSYSEEYVIAHHESERVLLCAVAPIAAVDWPVTIVLNTDGMEDEIRLKAGAVIKLLWSEPEANSLVARQFA
jgi:hypothetical protein